MLPATTSSSTSIPMRVTPSSLWVSVPGQELGGLAAGGVGQQVSQPPLTSPRPAPPVFIYSMPGYKCSIKERMLYSSCKSRLLDSVEQDFQLEISKKVGARSPEPHHPGACTTALHLGRWSPKAVVGQGY